MALTKRANCHYFILVGLLTLPQQLDYMEILDKPTTLQPRQAFGPSAVHLPWRVPSQESWSTV